MEGNKQRAISFEDEKRGMEALDDFLHLHVRFKISMEDPVAQRLIQEEARTRKSPDELCRDLIMRIYSPGEEGKHHSTGQPEVLTRDPDKASENFKEIGDFWDQKDNDSISPNIPDNGFDMSRFGPPDED